MTEETDTITIRVPKPLKEKLENLSKKNQLNLNLLINQILSKNVHWDEHLTKMGWLQFDPSTVKEIFKYLTEEKLTNLAKSIKGDIIKGIKFIYGDTSLPHTIEFMESWLQSTNIPFRHIQNSDSDQFLVNHVIGKNWSIFASKVSEEFIKELGYSVRDVHADTDSYSFTISK